MSYPTADEILADAFAAAGRRFAIERFIKELRKADDASFIAATRTNKMTTKVACVAVMLRARETEKAYRKLAKLIADREAQIEAKEHGGENN